MTSAEANSMRTANAILRAGLARLQVEANDPCQLQLEDLSSLLDAVSAAAKGRGSLAPGRAADAEMEKELSEYRSNLEELARVLPISQGRLLAESARLQNAGSCVAKANAWAKASKDTL